MSGEQSRVVFDQLVSADDIRKIRSAEEFLIWFRELWSALSTNKETRDYLQLKGDLAKRLREEIFLASLFLPHEPLLTNADVYFPLDNGPRDLIIFGFPTSEDQTPIEITNALDGDPDHKRMAYLARHGHVSLTGEIKKLKRKGEVTRIIVENEMKEHSLIITEISQHVRKAIRKKNRKFADRYSASTWLLVGFDDGLIFVSKNKDKDYEFIISEAKSEVSKDKFERIYLIGRASGDACFRIK